MRNQSETRSLAAVKTPISREALDQLFSEAKGMGSGSHEVDLPLAVGKDDLFRL
jgi:hypothetical protein